MRGLTLFHCQEKYLGIDLSFDWLNYEVFAVDRQFNFGTFFKAHLLGKRSGKPKSEAGTPFRYGLCSHELIT